MNCSYSLFISLLLHHLIPKIRGRKGKGRKGKEGSPLPAELAKK
jgi:hypothetical protein